MDDVERLKKRLARERTARKEAERLLEEKSRSLYTANQNLESALERAQSADLAAQAKDQFLATMSHEIRTPMNGVLGLTELLAETNLNKDQAELVQTIDDSASTLLRIINDVLDFSKINAGHMQIRAVPFSPASVIQSVLDMAQATVRRDNLSLSASGLNGLPDLVTGDPDRFRQILSNLVGNAVKFTEQGSVQVKAGYGPDADGNAQLVVHVIDTGPGIAADDLKILFRPFTQVDSTNTANQSGTGLGLAISRSLAGLMNGSITATSIVGEGSDFCVTIPATKSTTAVADEAAEIYAPVTEAIEQKIRAILYASTSQDTDALPELAQDLSTLCSSSGSTQLAETAAGLAHAVDEGRWGSVFERVKDVRAALDVPARLGPS